MPSKFGWSFSAKALLWFCQIQGDKLQERVHSGICCVHTVWASFLAALFTKAPSEVTVVQARIITRQWSQRWISAFSESHTSAHHKNGPRESCCVLGVDASFPQPVWPGCKTLLPNIHLISERLPSLTFLASCFYLLMVCLHHRSFVDMSSWDMSINLPNVHIHLPVHASPCLFFIILNSFDKSFHDSIRKLK